MQKPDEAVVCLHIRPEHLNTYGLPHGGIIFSIADEAGGAAAHTDGRYYVTQSSSFNFMKTQSSGTLYATGYVRRRGKAVTVAEVDITNEKNELPATGQFNYYCVGNDKAEQEMKLRERGF